MHKVLDLHLVLDNYSTHKTKQVQNWLKRHKRFHLHFIPTSSSWLNLVERFFALITEDARTATVTAATSLRCYMIAFWDFRKFAKENPDLMWKLLQHLAALLTAERERHARASLLSS